MNVELLRKRVPNLTSSARSVGLRPATVSNLCTGKIPIGRSEVRTLVALASLAGCKLDELILDSEPIDVIESKIKAVDLFSPLVRGGTVGLVSRQGLCQVELLFELLYRLKKEGYVTIFLTPEGEVPAVKKLYAHVNIVAHSMDDAYEEILKIEGNKEIIFAADCVHVLTGKIFELKDRLPKVKITTFLINLKGGVDEVTPYGPLDTIVQFDEDLATRMNSPAINPVFSTSTALEGAHLSHIHHSIQQRAQKLLRRYRELLFLVKVRGINNIPSTELQTFYRGERLEAYLTQPFYVTESYIGRKGESVSLQDTLSDVRKILDGRVDSTRVENLKYIGKL